MLEKIINKTLPFYPWSDPRLIKLPGTNSLGQEPLFLMCDRFKEQMALKDYLVNAKAEKVCLVSLETEDILHECLDFIIACVRKNPRYKVYEHSVIRPDNVQIDLKKQTPIENIGRLIQEDILIHQLDLQEKRYKLIAGALCFPSFWTLSQKMGMNLDRMHKPVPEYSEDIAKRVDRMFVGLRPEMPIWRTNWTVKNNPNLYMPLLEEDVLPEAFNLEKDWWIRIERQTFNKLPLSGAVLFGIHTYLVSPKSLEKVQLEKLLEKLKLKTLIHHHKV
ncbi:MAG: heme-dependent oxidative N-demethylase family protein [Paracoccaceae bacterium]